MVDHWEAPDTRYSWLHVGGEEPTHDSCEENKGDMSRASPAGNIAFAVDIGISTRGPVERRLHDMSAAACGKAVQTACRHV
jgi:hypothetical protein